VADVADRVVAGVSPCLAVPAAAAVGIGGGSSASASGTCGSGPAAAAALPDGGVDTVSVGGSGSTAPCVVAPTGISAGIGGPVSSAASGGCGAGGSATGTTPGMTPGAPPTSPSSVTGTPPSSPSNVTSTRPTSPSGVTSTLPTGSPSDGEVVAPGPGNPSTDQGVAVSVAGVQVAGAGNPGDQVAASVGAQPETAGCKSRARTSLLSPRPWPPRCQPRDSQWA
jgi:hypothetical protein